MARWSRSLRLAVDLLLESPLAMILLWGEDLVQIYNDGYREVMAGKHPSGLGQPSPECWPEVRSFTVPVHEAVLRGEGRSFRGQKLVLERGDGPGEAWFDLTYIPVRSESGAVAGIPRPEEHTSELQSLMRVSYAVFCLQKKNRLLLETKPH